VIASEGNRRAAVPELRSPWEIPPLNAAGNPLAAALGAKSLLELPNLLLTQGLFDTIGDTAHRLGLLRLAALTNR
jgi:hypothetical protein